MVSWDQDDLTVMGRRDDATVRNMALGGENGGSQCQQLWLPVGLTGSTAVQQKGTFHWVRVATGELRGQQGAGPIPASAVLWSWTSHLTPQGPTASL